MPAGQNLAPISDELLEDIHVLVVDVVNLVDGKIVDLLPPEETTSTAASTAARPAARSLVSRFRPASWSTC